MFLTNKNSILEALRSSRTVHTVQVHRGAKKDKRLQEIIGLCEEKSVGLEFREIGIMKRGTGSSRPVVVAQCEEIKYAELEEILKNSEKAKPNFPLIVALDHVQDPGNLGAVIRSCAAADAMAIIIEKHRCCSVTDTVADTASGGIEHLAVIQVGNLVQALEKAKNYGWWVIGADENAEKTCIENELNFPLCLVLGAEGAGLSHLVGKKCDNVVRIPTNPKFPTLNISAAASILIFEALRQWRLKA